MEVPVPAAIEAVSGRREAIEAGEMLARAFHDDPYAVYALPDAETRPAVMKASFAWAVAYGQLYGRAWRTAGKLDGVAVVLPPSTEHYSQERLAATGYQRFERAVAPELWPTLRERHDAVFGYCEQVIQDVVPEGYHCLDVLGVDLDRQGQGIGSTLIEAVNDPFGTGGPGSYVLTFNSRTVPFYRRNGYEFSTSGVEPSSGLGFWVMARPPHPRRARRPGTA